jgi:hypothetical protein
MGGFKDRCHFLDSGMSVVAFTHPDTGQIYSLQDKLQVTPGDNAILALPGCLGELEGSFFQALVEYAKPVPFKTDQLYLITLPVEKDKYVARQWVLSQLRPDQSTQAIEALAHIGAPFMKIITMGRG